VEGPIRRKPKGRFRYELLWEEHEDFSPMVAQTWKEEGEAHTLDDSKHKLEAFYGHLEEWQ
jgi:hypothetical protein